MQQDDRFLTAFHNVFNAALSHASALPVDKSLCWALIIGLFLGLAIAMALAFFPGEPLGIEYGNLEVKESDADLLHDAARKNGEPDVGIPSDSDISSGRHNAVSTDNAADHGTSCANGSVLSGARGNSSEKDLFEWARDRIGQAKLDQDQACLGRSNEPMRVAVSGARCEAAASDECRPRWDVRKGTDRQNDLRNRLEGDKRHAEPAELSLSQKVDVAVYCLLFACLVYFLNRDYGNIVTIWFIRNFPREAETLGIGSELFSP